jgi:MFS transporter, ACS family, hexuronate transporter
MAERIGRLRWWIISLVTLGTILNYLARSSLSVAAPTLMDIFDMDTQQYSWVVFAFQATYTVMQTFSGAILDFLGTRIGFTIFVTGWALANMGHALAGGWFNLAFWRALLGSFEAAAIPGGMKVVSEWFPPKERTVATGVFNMGSSIGNMIAPALVVFCILAWGWQSAFLVTGGLSLLFGAMWFLLYRSPRDNPRLSAAERRHIGGDPVTGSTSAPRPANWREVIATRGFWSIAIPRFLAEPAWHTFNFFIPLYLVMVWDFELKDLALWAWLPFLAADAGSLLGGFTAPALIRWFGIGLLASRKLTVTIGALLMIGPACIGLATSPGVAIALFCVGGFAHQMLSGALLTLSADLFDQRAVGIATGMAGSIGWIGGALFTLVVGALAETIGYNPLFVMLALFDLAGAAVLWALLRGERADQPSKAG